MVFMFASKRPGKMCRKILKKYFFTVIRKIHHKRISSIMHNFDAKTFGILHYFILFYETSLKILI